MAKGDETHYRILDRALALASTDGLGGLSLGELAAEANLSKSGLYAHFGSKQQLELEILAETAERFQAAVWEPALRAARGEPRIRALFERWLKWVDGGLPGGCVFVTASVELDDKTGKPRDLLVKTQRELTDALAKSAKLAIDEGHFRSDLDTPQFAFELYSIVLGYNHQRRLLRDRAAGKRARRAFERLLDWAH